MKIIKLRENISATYVDENTVKVSGLCVFTGKYYEVNVDRAGFDMWRNGVLIQFALPNTDINTREFIISGISPAGWSQAFPEEPEIDWQGDED